MHGPRRANPERFRLTNCKSRDCGTTPLETPPCPAGNRIVSGCNPPWSANQIAKMRNLASYFLAFDLETDDRRIELDSRHLRPDYRLPRWRLQVEQNLDPTGQSKRREWSK